MCNGNCYWKPIYDNAPAVIGIWTNKTKHTKDCIRTEFIWIFLWKSARYIQCHLPWSWNYISNMAAHVLLLCIWYKQHLSLGTQQGIFWLFMTKMKQLFQILELHSMTCFLDDHCDKIYRNIFAIYLIPWIKPYIYACVFCYFEWQSPITLSK